MSDVPELTEAEATALAYHDLCRAGLAGAATRIVRSKGLLAPAGITDLGRAALAAFDKRKRAEIEAPLRELLRRLVDFCDRGPKDPFTNSALLDADAVVRGMSAPAIGAHLISAVRIDAMRECMAIAEAQCELWKRLGDPRISSGCIDVRGQIRKAIAKEETRT